MQDRTSERLARLGYAARGVVYVIVGGLAVLGALGKGGGTTDTKGALSTLLAQPFGSVLLAIVAFGLLCFGLWRLAQAVLDVDRLGTDWKAIARRIGFVVSAVVNAGLALAAVRLIMHSSAGSGSDSSARDWTAWLLSMPFGQWLVGLVGLIVVGTGIATALKGWKGSFEDRLSLDPGTRRWVVPMGRLGYLARGLVFGVIGVFLIIAALHANAGEARGLAGALRALQQQPYGSVVFLVTALGLLAFGAFQFVVARYRRIQAPSLQEAARAAGRQVQAGAEAAR